MWVLNGLASALLGGANTVLSKRCVRGVDAIFAIVVRTLAVLAVAIVAVQRNALWREIAQIEGVSWLLLLLSGVATAFAWVFYYKGLKQGSANGVAAIDKLSIILTMLGGCLILNEPVTKAKLISSPIIVLGIGCMAGKMTNAVDTKGNIGHNQSNCKWKNHWQFWSILSAIFVSVSAVLSKAGLKSVDSRLLLLVRTVIVLFVSLILLFSKQSKPNKSRVGAFTLIILLGSGILTGIGWLFYFQAMSVGDAGIVHAIDKLSILVTAVLSGIVWRKGVSFREGVGLLAVSLGISLLIIL